MDKVDWNAEPDLERLQIMHGLLKTNPSEALKGLEKMAENGSTASILYLASFYMREVCSSYGDESKAKFWCKKVGTKDSPEACYMLGRLECKSGAYKEALAAFSSGAEGNYPPATYRLAKMYQRGEGTAQDLAKARSLLENAKKRGHVFAKRDLAGLLLTGKFGCRSAIEGAFMLIGLWSDIGLLIARAVKTGASLDERILA